MKSITKTKWSSTRLPAFETIHNVTGQRFVYKMSSEVLLERKNNVVTNGELQSSKLSSYETAMEKLSSLITRQRRGEKPPVPNKLERMSTYLQILGLEEDINRLNIIHVAGTKGKVSDMTERASLISCSSCIFPLFLNGLLARVQHAYSVRQY